MRRPGAALIFVAAVVAPISTYAETSPEAQYLEGNWAIVDDQKVASCGFPSGRGDQIGFEFARSGGRAAHYEAPDLFTYISGVEAHSEGDILNLTARTRAGEVKPFMMLRRKGPNEAEIVSKQAKGPVTTLKRCPVTNAAISAGLNDMSLFALTPNYTGGGGFPEVRTGESVADLCDVKVKQSGLPDERLWFQIDLIGPSHFWMLVMGREPVAGFYNVNSARQLTPTSVRLSVQNLDNETAKSLRSVTLEIASDRIRVPELGATFARCRSDQAASGGMGRL